MPLKLLARNATISFAYKHTVIARLFACNPSIRIARKYTSVVIRIRAFKQ